MSWRSMLWDQYIKRVPNTIRRFHATTIDNLPGIFESAELSPTAKPNLGARLHERADYPGVYTTVLPTRAYFEAESPTDALITLDLPKDWYRTVPRRSHNTELPNPQSARKFIDDNLDGDDWQRQWQAAFDWHNIITVPQGGRTDIFLKPIPTDYISDVLKPVEFDKHGIPTLHEFMFSGKTVPSEWLVDELW